MRLLLLVALTATLCQAASLSITRAEIERMEDGHAVFAPDTFAPGETVHLSFYVEGFTRKENMVKLRFHAQPVDSAGVPLVTALIAEQITTLTPEDKDWLPKLRVAFTLPGVLSAGPCQIHIRLDDELSEAFAERDLSFIVSGSKVDPSDKLAIRNLDFYSTEDDERPLDVAAYRIAEEVHARFQLVGYRHNDLGGIDIAYGISIADSTGRVLFAEPSAARDKSEDFYPKPYVQGVVGFSLKPGTPAGEYVLTVTASDRLGDQKAEVHRGFRLE